MRVVAALGGNALLLRGERPDASIQLTHVAQAVAALAPLAAEHDLLITHGNGPQVGMLALESADDSGLSRPYPLDALVAETQGMIGYWLARELRAALPGRQVVTLLTNTLVDHADPAFDHPTKFIGAQYNAREATLLTKNRGWTMRQDGGVWRRVVPSPQPHDILEIPAITHLMEAGWIVIAAGGGGIPVTSNGRHGVEAVVDKDLTAALLAERTDADALLLLTDVPNIYLGYGTPEARPLGRTTPEELRALVLPDGSMGPKAEAACRFVQHRPEGMAAIGRLADADALLRGEAGTFLSKKSQAAQADLNPGHGRMTDRG